MLAAMDEPSLPPSGIRFDPIGVALMVLALAIGLVNRALLPGADECREIDPISPLLLSASVIAFGFGLVRCLVGPARRYGSIVMVAVSALLVAFALFATTNIGSPDCG